MSDPPWADGTVEQQSVTARQRPEYDPVGVRLGSFFFLPSLGVGESYDSNVFATESDLKNDYITVVSPRLLLKSDWGRHELYARATGDFGLYKSFTSQNYNDYTAETGGRLDIARDQALSGSASYANLHEDRSSPDDVGGTEPTTYERAGLNARYAQKFNRLGAALEARGDHLSFNNVPLFGGGTLDSTDRDRFETEGAVRVSYNFLPTTSVFTRAAYNRDIYDHTPDNNGFDRDSQGYRVDLGFNIDVTELLKLEASVGYLNQSYDDSRLASVSDPAGTLLATWNITRLTTMKANFQRTATPTTLSGASAEVDTGGFVSLDHELLRNLILSARFGYTNTFFEGIPRVDNTILGAFSARYLLFQGASVSANYQRDDRSSNTAGADYNRDVIALRFAYGF
ncbi:MAG: outer membrane beta-barrel protein [Alphaproteobacteria bacterium]